MNKKYDFRVKRHKKKIKKGSRDNNNNQKKKTLTKYMGKT